jgi:hypothetical protein
MTSSARSSSEGGILRSKALAVLSLITGAQRVVVGDLARQATRYALKRKLGAALRLFATFLGMAPADQEC